MSDGVLIVTIPALIIALSSAVAAVWKWLTTRGMSRKRSADRMTVSDEATDTYKLASRKLDRENEELNETIFRRNQSITDLNRTIEERDRTIADLRRAIGGQTP